MKPVMIILAILVGLFVLALAASVTFFWLLNRPPSVQAESVLEMTVGGPLRETSSQHPFLALLEQDRPSLYDYWRILDSAADDDRVKGIFLEIQPLLLSMAQIEELRDALAKFRQSGKPVHAFLALDMVGDGELYLGSAADTITLNPDTALLVNGLYAEVTFYKRTLEKLGIQPHFIQFKEYKSPEIYSREDLSPEFEEMYRSLLEDMQNRIVSQIATDRQLEHEAVRRFIEDGMATPDDAQQAGLIDAQGYRIEVHERFGGTDTYKALKMSQYLETLNNRSSWRGGTKVALVTGEGVITSGKSDAFSETLGGSTLARHLRELREEDDYRAVLLRVNSPGGSAVGSDMVWKEVRLLQEAGIPVIVSMSGVAGSGGYYIAMGAKSIVSQPSTITGSIGVIFGKFDMEGLFDWMGVSVDRIKLAPNADVFSPVTPLTEEQRRNITSWMQKIYDEFVGKAADGRGMTYDELEAKAKGRVYTGAQAVELGLVDALGGYGASIAEVKEALGLEPSDSIQLVRYPPPLGFWESLTTTEFLETYTQNVSWRGFLEEQLHYLTTPAPRLLMPEARIQ